MNKKMDEWVGEQIQLYAYVLGIKKLNVDYYKTEMSFQILHVMDQAHFKLEIAKIKKFNTAHTLDIIFIDTY